MLLSVHFIMFGVLMCQNICFVPVFLYTCAHCLCRNGLVIWAFKGLLLYKFTFTINVLVLWIMACISCMIFPRRCLFIFTKYNVQQRRTKTKHVWFSKILGDTLFCICLQTVSWRFFFNQRDVANKLTSRIFVYKSSPSSTLAVVIPEYIWIVCLIL